MLRRILIPNACAIAVVALVAVLGCSRTENGGPGNAGAPVDTGEQPRSAADRTPHYEGLIEEYQSVLADDPHNIAMLTALGNVYFDSRQWKDAIRYYEETLQLDPHDPDVITDLGTCWRNLGDPDLAIAKYQQALRIEPTHQNALFNIGVVYGFDKKQYAKAIAVWDKLLHVAPRYPQADFVRATVLHFKELQRRGL